MIATFASPFFRIHRIWRDWRHTSNLVSRMPEPAMGFCWQDMVSMSGARRSQTPNAILKCSNISCNANERCDNMAELRVPDRQIHLAEERAIRQFLQERGIWYEHRSAEASQIGPSDKDILQAHDHWLKPFMDKNGYRTADVIRADLASAGYVPANDNGRIAGSVKG